MFFLHRLSRACRKNSKRASPRKSQLLVKLEIIVRVETISSDTATVRFEKFQAILPSVIWEINFLFSLN